MVPGVTENRTRTPLLVFAVREGVVVLVVAENGMRNPPTWICSERGWCLLVIPILIVPHIHSISSCSWQRLRVLSWWWSSGPPCCPALIVVVVVVIVVLPLSLSCPHRHCHYPALVVIVVLPLSSCCHCHHSTHYPPHEQLLVDIGQVLLVCHGRRWWGVHRQHDMVGI